MKSGVTFAGMCLKAKNFLGGFDVTGLLSLKQPAPFYLLADLDQLAIIKTI